MSTRRRRSATSSSEKPLARSVAKEDPPLRVQLLDELRLPEPAAVAVLDRDPESLHPGTAAGEWADRVFDPKVHVPADEGQRVILTERARQ